MKQANIVNDLINALTSEWQTYRQLSIATGHKVGTLASVFSKNIHELEGKLIWDIEVCGNKHWEMRMIFKKIDK